jgi:histone deacetylase 11
LQHNDRDIYPQGAESELTKRRVNIALPISSGTDGSAYLRRLHEGLALLQSGYAIAFVVAGTDVLAGDPLGGLNLSIDDCVQRDALVLERLQALGVPAVFLGGGGYAANSAKQIAASLTRLHAQ